MHRSAAVRCQRPSLNAAYAVPTVSPVFELMFAHFLQLRRSRAPTCEE